MSQRLALVLVALALLAGALLLFEFGSNFPAQDLSDRSTSEESTRGLAEVGLPTVEQGSSVASSQRQADFVRIEVRGELVDGTIVHGPMVMVGGIDRVAEIAMPEKDGATYVYGKDGEVVSVQIIHYDEGSGRTLEASKQCALVDGLVLVLPLRGATAMLTGVVVRDGLPVPNAAIRLTHQGESRAIPVDENGRFEHSGILGVRGELVFGDQDIPAARLPVEVAPGSRQDVVFELPGGELTIQVVPEDGSEFRGAVMVAIYRVDAEQDEARLVPRAEVSSDRGIARFPGLPAGEYWVEVSRFTNSRSAPSVARVHYQGGFLTERVQMQAAAKLKLQVHPSPDLDPSDLRKVVRVWETARDGVVVNEWQDTQQVLLFSEERPWTTLEFQPGELQIRVGGPEVGFADATVTLWPGLETELIVQLNLPELRFKVRLANTQPLNISQVHVVDELGRWVGSFDARSMQEIRVQDDSGSARIRVGFNSINQHAEAAFAVPSPGVYRFFGVRGKIVTLLGVHRITAETKELTLAPSD